MTIAVIMQIDTGRERMWATDASVGVGAGVTADASYTKKVKTMLLSDTTKNKNLVKRTLEKIIPRNQIPLGNPFYLVLVSLYFRALVSMSSFSKSLRRDLKVFFGVLPVLSAISWRVSSLLSFRVFMTS